MPDKTSERSTFIKAETLKNGTLKNNIVIGDVDFLRAKKIEGLDASGNVHITPPQPVGQSWYTKLWGQLLIGVVASLLASAILYYYGFLQNHILR